MTHLLSTLASQLEPFRASHNRLVLGLSGGLDSRVLLQLLATLRDTQRHNNVLPEWEIQAIHVHHGLSENADVWAQQCKAWCEALSIEFVCEKVTVEFGSRLSLEQQARDARYQALAQYIDKRTLLLTGHHADDQFETFLLALKRGSGPKGLSSMAMSRIFHDGVLLRPLLGCDRNELYDYATSLELEWVEDESNTDTRFDRNFLRHDIIPSIKQRWPQVTQQVIKSTALCAEQEQLLTELLTPIYQHCLHNDALLIAPLLEQSCLTQKRLVRMWFAERGRLMPSQKILNQILNQVLSAKADATPIVELENGQLRRFQNALYIVDSLPELSDWQQPLPLETWVELPAQQGTIGVFSDDTLIEDHCFWVGNISDSSDLSGLTVSYNSAGLKAKPVGRSGSRKLKKLWQEYSVPPWLRQRYPIVLQQLTVIAVAGLFTDQRFCGTGYKVMWKKEH
ncbi:hypothetical protein ST37_11385 [Vibrio sp. qd031]|uniref:tRNA lysidine(34) synthetase TilS n=1 Tax=Vibrio sp. qd031 TaxID=1603038 RepID=UPI000A10C46C|nr:tRNA lysidine(34) synthetase TilS [Vibrio sp. qd031]ORT50459.1 hypothetical protein ST37_11385 [Vibrio sp. qd031]